MQGPQKSTKIYQLSLLLNYKKWHCHAHNKQTYKQKRIKIDINNIKKKKIMENMQGPQKSDALS